MSFRSWCARFVESFVTERVCEDGTRVLIANDPTGSLGLGAVFIDVSNWQPTASDAPMPGSWFDDHRAA